MAPLPAAVWKGGEEWQKANGKEQMENGFVSHLKFTVCHLPFEIPFSSFPAQQARE